MLQSEVGHKRVVGMFQASITTALQVLPQRSRFAIITTVPGFIKHLDKAVGEMLGFGDGMNSRFAGTFASGITWEVLTKEPEATAKQKMIDIVRKLVRREEVSVICLGGAILVGMSPWVREGCMLELGAERGAKVQILDPVLTGMTALYSLSLMRAID